jgi:hypothetical protein
MSIPKKQQEDVLNAIKLIEKVLEQAKKDTSNTEYLLINFLSNSILAINDKLGEFFDDQEFDISDAYRAIHIGAIRALDHLAKVLPTRIDS